MRKPTVFLAVIIIGAIVAVSFIYSGLYDVSANAPHGGVVSWLLSTTSHASVERHARGIDVPDLSDDALALAGVNDFDSMCAGCHGAPGREPEAMGIGLNPPAPDLAEEAAEMTAAELFWVTKNGIRMTGMPAWGKSHEDEDLWPVIALLTRLPEMDSDTYESMLAAAAGMGHHSTDAPAAGRSHDEESDDHGTLEHP